MLVKTFNSNIIIHYFINFYWKTVKANKFKKKIDIDTLFFLVNNIVQLISKLEFKL